MTKKKININKILSYCIFAIILIIILGTFFVFISNLFSSKESSSFETVELETIELDSMEIYRKIGKIRTASMDGIPIVISVYFPFEKEDREFYEEISIKNESLKSVISNYFLGFTYDQLKAKNEKQIQKEILFNLNNKLVLNQITELYFEEFVYFD